MSSKMTTTKKSVESLHQRGSGIFTRSTDQKARLGFRDDLEESSFTVSGTAGTAVTASSSSRVENTAAARKGVSRGSGDGAVGGGEGGGEKGASAGSGRLGAFLSAIPLAKLKIVIGDQCEANETAEWVREDEWNGFPSARLSTHAPPRSSKAANRSEYYVIGSVASSHEHCSRAKYHFARMGMT